MSQHFLRTLHIRVKKGIIPPPAGFTASLRVNVFEPSVSKNIETVESPLLNYAKQFAELHKEVGYLSDGRLSQDSYNFAGLKIQYLKKGLNENQADLQAKRDVVKNLEIRAMELDLIQNQANKIGVPSFQPKTHLELIKSLSRKIDNRRAEYLYVEKREILETSLKLKFQYNDFSPLQYSQVSDFTPIEYFTFIKEHPEYQKVLLLPIVDEGSDKVTQQQQQQGQTISDIKAASEFDDDFGEDDAEEKHIAQEALNAAEATFNVGQSGYKIYDYYLVPENLYFNPPSYAGDLIHRPGLNSYVPDISDSNDMLDQDKPYDQESQEDQEEGDEGEEEEDLEGDILGFNKRDLDLENYEKEMDESKLEQEDFCIRVSELNQIPTELERTELLKNQLKKNFFTQDSLNHSNISIQADRFTSKDETFPSVSDFTLNKYSRYPTISAIKTLRHLFLEDSISKELKHYLERQDGVSFHERVSQDYNIQKNYLYSDLSNIDSLEQLSKYNEIIKNSKSNSNDVEFKELYINTVLGITDSIYLNPINEQKILEKKYGGDFVFEEEVINRTPEEEKKDIMNRIKAEDIGNVRGPVFGEDGLIDLQNTNIYSANQLYESSITELYKLKYKQQAEKEEQAEKEAQEKTQEQPFQEFVSNEVNQIIKGESSLDPLYLLKANDNRVLLNNNNNNDIANDNNNDNNTPTIRKKTSFNSFYEKYILPKDIDQYAEYYKKDIVSKADKSRMEAQGLTRDIGKAEERYEEIKKLARDTDEPFDITLAKEYLDKEVVINTFNSNPSLSKEEVKMAQHQKLYPEYYKDADQIKLRDQTNELATNYLSVEAADHQYNAAPSFQDEDKVDFRQLKLDAETESRYAKEIKEFRDKDSRGEITDEDSYEFTNYINFLKERDATTPLVRKVRSKYLFKEHHNEMIDSFNQELLSTLENDTNNNNQTSEVEKNMEQLVQMIPNNNLRELTINSILSKYDK